MEDEKVASTGWFGPILVAATACILTVTILGSLGILGWRFYDRWQLQERVRTLVSSLENRTPEELADRAAQLKERPKVARYVLPQIRAAIARSPSEQQQWSAIRIGEAFIQDRSMEESLFQLRTSPRERIAAEATRILSLVQPPSHAAERLGSCLVDATCSAAQDEACAGLMRLGDVGRVEMQKHLPELNVGRRLWLVRYVNDRGGAYREAWLQMLAKDEDTAVRTAAVNALADETHSAARSDQGPSLAVSNG
ncbi:MAG: hypothetical protein H6819_11610 [Phycisphaerales bacterium]|nr:hypothetical protein [Phycisphaerales bacterium]MCB9856783.1 hypothetical protein [Phycisphaerales bacterium]MCB9862090.1 hypothetical protein [Phycisphaerales bacterium]